MPPVHTHAPLHDDVRPLQRVRSEIADTESSDFIARAAAEQAAMLRVMRTQVRPIALELAHSLAGRRAFTLEVTEPMDEVMGVVDLQVIAQRPDGNEQVLTLAAYGGYILATAGREFARASTTSPAYAHRHALTTVTDAWIADVLHGFVANA